jgi:hypothetical protein
MFVQACNSIERETIIINIVQEYINEYLVYELDNVEVYLPKNDVIKLSDSLCNNNFGEFFCYFASYLRTQEQTLIIMDSYEIRNDIYMYVNKEYAPLDLSYGRFGRWETEYAVRNLQENLQKGNVKLYDKKSKKYLETYKLVREKGNLIGETEYYYSPDGSLFFECIIALGL